MRGLNDDHKESETVSNVIGVVETRWKGKDKKKRF